MMYKGSKETFSVGIFHRSDEQENEIHSTGYINYTGHIKRELTKTEVWYKKIDQLKIIPALDARLEKLCSIIGVP